MIFFVDVEASSLLPGSFPIEVAWVDQQGRGETYLIRPTEAWLSRGCPGWSAESEKVHGIALDCLLAEGLPIDQVANRAATVLSASGATVYSDAPDRDEAWLFTLLAAGGGRGVVHVRPMSEALAAACDPLIASIAHLDGLKRDRMEAHIQALSRAIIVRATQFEAQKDRIHHRAYPDAEGLWRTWVAVANDVKSALAADAMTGSPPPIYRANYRGHGHEVRRVDAAELNLLFASVDPASACDTITSWSLIAIVRNQGGPLDVHALGWRVAEDNTWITSPLEALDLKALAIRTRSGNTYRLGHPDGLELATILKAHLRYALRAWGFQDVEP